MMAKVKGQTKKALIPPKVIKDLDPKESLLPATIDLRNLRITQAGNTEKRRGYAQKWDVGNDNPITQLIPEGQGYITDDKGKLYRIFSDVGRKVPAILELDRSVAPGSRPTWNRWGDDFYIWSGGIPLRITPTDIEVAGGDPPHAKFSAVIGNFVVVSGYNETGFRWCALGNPESWPSANFADIEKIGSIQSMIEYKKHLLFFTEREIEVRNLSSGAAQFSINNALHANKGLAAPYSVVKAADDRVYWLGNDGDIYVMDNFAIRNISSSYSKELFTMKNREKTKGFDIIKEKHIKFVNQEDGKTYIYDYEKDLFFEDNIWEGSGWQAFPMNAYMELDQEQYFGDINCTGIVHKISEDHLDDNGSEIRTLRQFAIQPSERGHKAIVHRIRLRRSGGVGTIAETNPVILIEYRWDKKPFRVYPNLSQGAMEAKNPYVDMRRIGRGRELELRITEMQDVRYLLQDMLVTYEELNG